ncbi:MAG TPA: PqqD family protein [Pyrinomonadaceae bacterium]|nr:PqqD family protein [Pyrinomonadaceae bacterium]
MSAADKAFIKGEDLMTRNIAGETLIVPVRNRIGDLDSIYTMNEVGSRIWELIDGQTSVSRIADLISSEYEVTPEAAERDVLEMCDSLREAGLIRVAGGDEA